jgi:hypothetical protein
VEWWFLWRWWPGKRAIKRRFHVCAAFRSGIGACFFWGRTTALKQIETIEREDRPSKRPLFHCVPRISRK